MHDEVNTIETISRDEFLRISNEVLSEPLFGRHDTAVYVRPGDQVPAELTEFEAAALHEAAATMKLFAMDTYVSSVKNCGCLVGEAFMRKPDGHMQATSPGELNPALRYIGNLMNEVMHDYLESNGVEAEYVMFVEIED